MQDLLEKIASENFPNERWQGKDIDAVAQWLGEIETLPDELWGHLSRVYWLVENDTQGLQRFLQLLIRHVLEDNDPYGEAEELLAFLCSDDNINTRSVCRWITKTILLETLKSGEADKDVEKNTLRLMSTIFPHESDIKLFVEQYQPKTTLGRIYAESVLK